MQKRRTGSRREQESPASSGAPRSAPPNEDFMSRSELHGLQRNAWFCSARVSCELILELSTSADVWGQQSFFFFNSSN